MLEDRVGGEVVFLLFGRGRGGGEGRSRVRVGLRGVEVSEEVRGGKGLASGVLRPWLETLTWKRSVGKPR